MEQEEITSRDVKLMKSVDKVIDKADGMIARTFKKQLQLLSERSEKGDCTPAEQCLLAEKIIQLTLIVREFNRS